MKNVKDVVLQCHNALLKEKGINKISSPDMDMTRENGIDSLGIVSLVLEIEEELGVELDSVLAMIRKSKKIAEFIEVIENAIG